MASPWSKTIAGRANLLATHPLNAGPIGVTGSDSANAIAKRADVVVAVARGLPGFHPLRGRGCSGTRGADRRERRSPRRDEATCRCPWSGGREASGCRALGALGRLPAHHRAGTQEAQACVAPGTPVVAAQRRPSANRPKTSAQAKSGVGERALPSRATAPLTARRLAPELAAKRRTFGIGNRRYRVRLFRCHGLNEIAGAGGAQIAAIRVEPDRGQPSCWWATAATLIAELPTSISRCPDTGRS